MRPKDKQVRVSADIHRTLRAIAFNNDIYLEDLVDAILKYVLKDKELIGQLIDQLRKRSRIVN